MIPYGVKMIVKLLGCKGRGVSVARASPPAGAWSLQPVARRADYAARR